MLIEWVRTWLFTGFPWLFAGYAHLSTPLTGWAPIVGVLGLSFAACYTGTAIAQAIQQRKLASTHIAVVVSLWLFGPLLNLVNWVKPVEDKSVSIAMVQANIPQAIKLNRDQYWPTLNKYNSMSQPHWPTADIVIWPEGSNTKLLSQRQILFKPDGKNSQQT